jgi:putative ABC transport system permease protein
MIRAALRDLQWRRKRFVIAMAGVALVFGLGLVMTGLSASFAAEVDRTVDSIGASRWAVVEDSSGPFTSFSPVSVDTGGPDASPLLILRQTISHNDEILDIIVIGVIPGLLGTPVVKSGDTLTGNGQIVADRDLEPASVGGVLELGGRDFDVVGDTSGRRLFAGLPVVYISLADAQAIGLQGVPAASAFLFDQPPAQAPPGLKLMTPAEVKTDVLRPLDGALASIQLVRILLWVVAATIIGSVLYLQAIERTRDFAVFKATGTSTASIGAGLALQAVVLSLAAAVLAAIIGTVIAPLFPMHVEIPASGFVMLPVVTVVVGLLASLIALRRSVSVEPALAFGG